MSLTKKYSPFFIILTLLSLLMFSCGMLGDDIDTIREKAGYTGPEPEPGPVAGTGTVRVNNISAHEMDIYIEVYITDHESGDVFFWHDSLETGSSYDFTGIPTNSLGVSIVIWVKDMDEEWYYSDTFILKNDEIKEFNYDNGWIIEI